MPDPEWSKIMDDRWSDHFLGAAVVVHGGMPLIDHIDGVRHAMAFSTEAERRIYTYMANEMITKHYPLMSVVRLPEDVDDHPLADRLKSVMRRLKDDRFKNKEFPFPRRFRSPDYIIRSRDNGRSWVGEDGLPCENRQGFLFVARALVGLAPDGMHIRGVTETAINIEQAFSWPGDDIVDAWYKTREAWVKKADEADKRAERLLERHLTVDQRLELAEHGHFTVTARSGKRYRIHEKLSTSVYLLDDNGRPVECYCVHLDMTFPVRDSMLAQKVALEIDDSGLKAVANVFQDFTEDGRATIPITPDGKADVCAIVGDRLIRLVGDQFKGLKVFPYEFCGDGYCAQELACVVIDGVVATIMPTPMSMRTP
jgi:hypothetical protein